MLPTGVRLDWLIQLEVNQLQCFQAGVPSSSSVGRHDPKVARCEAKWNFWNTTRTSRRAEGAREAPVSPSRKGISWAFLPHLQRGFEEPESVQKFRFASHLATISTCLPTLLEKKISQTLMGNVTHRESFARDRRRAREL